MKDTQREKSKKERTQYRQQKGIKKHIRQNKKYRQTDRQKYKKQ